MARLSTEVRNEAIFRPLSLNPVSLSALPVLKKTCTDNLSRRQESATEQTSGVFPEAEQVMDARIIPARYVANFFTLQSA